MYTWFHVQLDQKILDGLYWEAKEARKIQKKTANDAKFQNATPKISSKVDANKMTQIKIYAYLESF